MERYRYLALILVVLVMSAIPVLAQDDDMMEGMSTVMLGGNDDLGAFLVDHDGMTLYIFANDEPGVSNCTGGCAENWPPLTIGEDESATLAEGIPGRLAVITREDESRQVVYNGMPLYYWINDEAPGDATGHNVNDVWFVATTPDVGLGGNEELGTFLVGADGMTLYTFANDEEGVSNCYDGCAENWPPLLVDSEEDLSVELGLVGDFGVIERTDETMQMQVTYDGWPLYFWVNDEAPGDATGHNVNDVWFVAKPPTFAVQENEDFGEILVGPNGMSLYTFANDEPGVTNCYDRCAVAWPPLFVAEGEEPVAAGDVMAEIGVIERDDGTYMVTYDGWPLYYWFRDIVPGDTTGHLVNDVWYIAVP